MSPLIQVARPAFANNVDAFIPEVWAQQGLLQLQANMVAARLVHRDFESLIANVGDTVNTRRPQNMTARRKARGTDITVEDAVAPNIAVTLDQHIYQSFLIHDSDSSKSMRDLHQEFLVPAMRSIAQQIDLTVLGQAWQFYMNAGGGTDATASIAAIMETRERLNTNLCPPDQRSLIVGPKSDSSLMQLAVFHEADKKGDTVGLLEASLGRKFGMNMYMCQNTPMVTDTYQPSLTTDILIDNAAGYGPGTTAITVNGRSAGTAPLINSWLTVAGDETPQRVVTVTGGTTPTAFTITPGLHNSVLDNAIVTLLHPTALVDLTAGYAAGWQEAILFDTAGASKRPQVGQAVIFANVAGTAIYTVTQVTGTGASGTLLLDRPLEAAIADGDTLALSPSAGLNFAFHRNCLTLAIRPLAMPYGGGANAAVAQDERIGAAIRIVAAYDQWKQATVVTIDCLAGIKVLDTNLGAVMCTSDY